MEKPIRFFNTLLLSLLLCGAAWAEQPVQSEVSPEVMEKVKKAFESFQKPLDGDGARNYQKASTKDGYKAVTGEDLQEDVADMEPQPGCETAQTGKVYYFFSFSMPRTTLKDTIRLIKGSKQANAVMVLRGFVNNRMKDTVMELRALSKEVGGEFPIEMDPFAFDKYSVTEVPTIAKEGEGIGKIKGVGLLYALDKFDTSLEDYGKMGVTYPIKEQHFMEFVKDKQPEIEAKLRKKAEKLKKEILILKKYDGRFKTVEEERVFYIDTTYTLEDDILDHKGNVLFQKGTTYNPADYVKLGRYVVIDGNDSNQVKFAVEGNFKKIIVSAGDIGKLMNKYKKPFYFLDDNIAERFQIQAVPTVFEGEGKYVKVTEVALDNSPENNK